MAKKKKQKSRPNISPLSVLRPRLDNLFAQPDWVEQENAAMIDDLTNIIANIDPEQYLPILVKAVNDAPEAVQLKLDLILPAWLRSNNLTETFTELVQRDLFEEQEYEVAVAWLTAAGVEQTALQVVYDPAFYRAFFGSDDMESQGVYLLLWYNNNQQTRVRGISVLVDFNPPWNGAAKEPMILPQRSPQEAIRDYVDPWRNGPMPLVMQELNAVEAKQQFLELLIANRENEIRLVQEFMDVRQFLVDRLFPLPDGPDTPLLTIEDFDELCNVGQATESIRYFEQRVGRRVRMEDGKELLIGADRFLDEDGFLDQIEVDQRESR